MYSKYLVFMSRHLHDKAPVLPARLFRRVGGVLRCLSLLLKQQRHRHGGRNSFDVFLKIDQNTVDRGLDSCPGFDGGKPRGI